MKIEVKSVKKYKDMFIIFTTDGKIFQYDPKEGVHMMTAWLKKVAEVSSREKDPD